MADTYGTYTDSVSSPARRCFVITPHDSNEVALITKAIRAPSDGVIMLASVHYSDTDSR